MTGSVPLIITLLLLLPACSSTAVTGAPDPPVRESREDLLRFSGRVVLVPIEGGFYGLVSEQGARFDPVNLQPAFQEDGLRVRVTARRLSGVVGFHMWGTRVEILEIERE